MIEKLDNNKWLNKLEFKKFPEPETIHLKNPVLLCHGYGAISLLVKPSPLYDVAMLMRTHNVRAYAPNIVPYAKIETRAESWVKIIDELSPKIPNRKINVIAHSMGGLDMRYALNKFDIADNIESFTTVCTPHRGTSLAELTLRTPSSVKNKVADFLNWMGDIAYPSRKSDAMGSARQLTRDYLTKTFNPEVPDVKGIPDYSFSSAVGKGTDQPITVMNRFQNIHIFEEEGINDGMVSVKSAKWGTHIKTGKLSHLEQINLRVKEERRELFRSFWLDVIDNLRQKGH